nr:glycosyltransferase [Planctomycetales bacterium]
MTDVLLIFEHASLNGGERSLLVVLDPLQRDGIRFRAIAPPAGPLVDQLTAAGVETCALPWRDAPVAGQPREALRNELAAAIRRLAPDLLHANSLTTSRLVGPVAYQLGVPSVGYLRDILRLNAGAVADLNGHTRLLAVSYATRAYHLAQGLDAGRTHVLFNGVDVHRFRPRPATGWLHRQLGLDPASPLMGGVGQIILRKGWDVWLETAARVVADQPQAHFVLVGTRHSSKRETCELEQRLRKASCQGPLRGRVHLLGLRDDVERVLPELAVLVHPARQEPLGRVLLEAAASGVPVVATDVGGVREIFGEGTPAAELVPVDDAKGLAAGVQRILRDREGA